MPTRQEKTKKSFGGGFAFSTLSFIVICAALAFGMSVFFRVSNVEVTGAKRYSDSEIVAASGVKDGDNLIFVDRAAIEERIYEKLLYIGSVTVSRRLPNTVVIAVDESSTFASLETDSGIWIVDRNCRVIEKLSAHTDRTDNIISVSGLKGVKPKKGAALSVAQEDEAKLTYLKDLLTAISAAGIAGDVSTLTIENSANPEMRYLDRFRVRFGRDEDLDSKLRLLSEVVARLEESDRGSIDLSQSKKAQFSPD
ncbi:MAG: cell division protein FtsQ/DivIB [Oscillospiraceae bacterium]